MVRVDSANKRDVAEADAQIPGLSRVLRRAERLRAMKELLEHRSVISVEEFTETLMVSSATVRRDLARLESQGLLIRSHGGAVRVERGHEIPIGSRELTRAQEKRRIAVKAVDLVADGEVVGITGGTTTMEVARALPDHLNLTVVTNALNVGAELALRRNIRLVLTGGVARSDSFELSGAIAERTIREHHLDVAFVGVDGADPVAGFTTHNDLEGLTNAALVAAARRVVVVADSSKLGQLKFVKICGTEAVDVLVTDAGAGKSTIAAFEAAGITVEIA